MGSDTHSVLPGGKSEWARAEQAVDRLIAAHQSLVRDTDSEAGTAPQQQAEAVPPQPAVAAAADAATPAARPFSARWPMIILLSALWLSIALVASAAFLAIAMLL
jgi:hypothetical protein